MYKRQTSNEEGKKRKEKVECERNRKNNIKQKEEKGGRLSVLSSKVERNLIERLD